MGEERQGEMRRKVFLILFIFGFIIMASGCETTRGLVKGVVEGVPQDTAGLWQAILKADKWFKENLW